LVKVSNNSIFRIRGYLFLIPLFGRNSLGRLFHYFGDRGDFTFAR